MNLLNNITTFKGERSRAVSPENPTGEKGRACMEDSALGAEKRKRKYPSSNGRRDGHCRYKRNRESFVISG